MLRLLYNKLPFSEKFKVALKNKLPLSLQRERRFRKFGSINELYLWRTDQDIDTIAPIQNFFSSLFPELDTKTRGKAWVFDMDGRIIIDTEFELPNNGFHCLRISSLVPRKHTCGTFMWHIQMPDSIAQLEMVKKNLIYFTDRGYICYEKGSNQPAFIHGVDRYAVFQEQLMLSNDTFYRKLEQDRTWIPEFPIEANMQTQIDVVLLNRTKEIGSCNFTLHKNGGEKVYESSHKIMPRGAVLIPLHSDVLDLLKGGSGYLSISGLPTKWGRPAIIRHFLCGSISVMHC